MSKIRHADLFGLRTQKYSALYEFDASSTDWQELQPSSPFYLFTPQDIKLREECEVGWKITGAVPVSTVGIVTGHDAEAIAFSRDQANVLAANKDVPHTAVQRLLYRPFDSRFVVYDKALVTRQRLEVMRHVLAGDNLALLFMRQLALNEGYTHFLATTVLVDNRAFYSNKGIMYLAPLYLYPVPEEEEKQKSLHLDREHWPLSGKGRRPNLNPEFVADMKKRLGMEFVTDGQGDLEKTFGPEDIFHYIYAVFHSPTYRTRYAEFLKIDFPRVPLTSDKELFRGLAGKGEELVSLHLMESPALNSIITKYEVVGSDVVEKVTYFDTLKRVSINKEQYFEGIEPDVWEFHIGGYQVLDKWLKDRKGRKLTWEDQQHYQKIVVALKETIRLMTDIDEIIPSWPIV